MARHSKKCDGYSRKIAHTYGVPFSVRNMTTEGLLTQAGLAAQSLDSHAKDEPIPRQPKLRR